MKHRAYLLLQIDWVVSIRLYHYRFLTIAGIVARGRQTLDLLEYSCITRFASCGHGQIQSSVFTCQKSTSIIMSG